MGRFRVESAQLSDLPDLFTISSIVHRTNYTQLIPDTHKEKFETHYTPTSRHRDAFVGVHINKMSRSLYRIYKAVDRSGVIAGYVSSEDKGSHVEIQSVFVAPQYQGQGVGSLLMEYIVTHTRARVMELYVIKGNTAAISLYTKYGFVMDEESDKTFYGSKLLRMVRLV